MAELIQMCLLTRLRPGMCWQSRLSPVMGFTYFLVLHNLNIRLSGT